MQKKRVAVIRGGPSAEYDVSVRTGASIILALRDSPFEPIDILISKTGEWLHNGRVRYPESIIPVVDVVCIALHGTYGEDGQIQRVLNRFNVPYTGTGAYASGIAMHKALAKEHLKGLSISFAPHRVVTRDSIPSLSRIAMHITDSFGPQYVIKPIASGSSHGIELVENPLYLEQALTQSLALHDEVIVEERILGTEATCGVIERFRDQKLYALPPIEIIPPAHAKFFNTAVKYDGSTKEICPACFPFSVKSKIEDSAKNIHEILGLSQYSRSDFIVDRNEKVFFLEVNTLPGLTEESLFPKALSAIGTPYKEFIVHLLTDAIETNRH